MRTGKEAALLLDDIIREIQFLEEACADKTVEDLHEDRVLAHAVKYALLSIGEAAKRVPPRVREAHPDLPWREMAHTRDFLAHGYDAVVLDVLWRTVHDDLRPLLPRLVAAREHERRA